MTCQTTTAPGSNAFHGDSAACLVVDGKLVAAAEEGRFRRLKHWAGFPSEAAKYRLASAGLTLADVDHVAVNRDPSANLRPGLSGWLAKSVFRRLDPRRGKWHGGFEGHGMHATRRRRHRWAVAVTVLALSVVLVAMGELAIPPVAGDAGLWMVAAVNMDTGNGAINLLEGRRWSEEAAVRGALDYYPLLYVQMLSGLMMAPTYMSATRAATVLKILSLVFLGWAWCRGGAAGPTPTHRKTLGVVLGLCTVFAFLYATYRPEVGVVFILACLVLALSYGFRGPMTWGGALALVAGSNPMCGLIFAGAVVVYFSRSESNVLSLIKSGVAGLVGVAGFLIVLNTGWGIEKTLAAMLAASQEQFYSVFEPAGTFRYLFLQRTALFLGVPLVVAFASLFREGIPRVLQGQWILGLSMVYLVCAVSTASLVRTEQVYNVFAFLPLAVSHILLSERRSWVRSGLFANGLASAGVIIAIVMLWVHVQQGVRYRDARMEWRVLCERLPAVAGGKVAASTSLWGLARNVEDLSRFRSLTEIEKSWDPFELSGRPLLIQQMFGSPLLASRKEPPETLELHGLKVDHYLALDRFQRGEPTLFGVRIGTTIPGWGFAVYLPREMGGADSGGARGGPSATSWGER